MSTHGVLECTFIESGVCADTFRIFLEEKLSSSLYPFNGTNPNSAIILDNAAIHHVCGVVDLLESLGVFLPSYSPDTNPIEELFAKVKNILMKNLLLMAFSAVTATDGQGWIRHAGY